MLLYVNPTPSQRDVSAAKTFVWTSSPGTVGGFQVELGRATPVGRKSDEIALHGYFNEGVHRHDGRLLDRGRGRLGGRAQEPLAPVCGNGRRTPKG